MRALITGITGFAGTHLARHLLTQGDDLLGITQHPSATPLPRLLPPNLELLTWDLTTPCPDSVRRRIDEFEPEAIYHLAAISHPLQCRATELSPTVERPSELAMRLNVGGTVSIAWLASELSAPPTVLFASSSHVYPLPDPARPVVDERTAAIPRDAYGETKLLAERQLERLARTHGFPAIIARAFKHAGPGQRPDFMLAEWALQAARGGPVRARWPESQIDLTDVRDIVVAYRLLIEHGKPGTIYNVGSGVNRRCGDICQALCDIAQVRYDDSASLDSASLNSASLNSPSPRPHQEPIANITRLTLDTGWHPKISLAQTLRDTLQQTGDH